MSGAEFGISRELFSFSQHCCCCCGYTLNKSTTQAVASRKLIDSFSSAMPALTGSRKSDRLKRLRANGRERNRMHALNSALAHLRDVLPPGSGYTRHRSTTAMSKIATLRAAQNYIRVLTSMLAELKSREDQGSKVAAAVSWDVSSLCGEVAHRQQNACYDGVFQQPDVASDDVIRRRPTAISDHSVHQQRSLADQHAVSLYSSHTVESNEMLQII